MSEPLIEDIEKYAQDCYNSFGYFYRNFVWPLLNGNTFLEPEYLIDLLCEYAEAFYYQKIRRLLVSIAPRNGKTTLFTIALPLWIWLRDPTRDLVTISSADDIIADFFSDTDILRSSDLFRYLFAFHHTDRVNKYPSNSLHKSENGIGGKHYQWTMLNTRTGIGADYVFVDDPIPVKEAMNQNYCGKVVREFKKGTMSRRHDKKVGSESPVIVIAQRLAEDDLIGVLKEEPGYTYLELQAIAEEDQTFVFPMSGRIWNRPEGHILNPHREDAETLHVIRAENPDFEAQWQCRPRQTEGALLTIENIRYYKRVQESYEKIIVSIDCAATKEVNSSNWGILVLGLKPDKTFDVLWCHARKYLYPGGKSKVFDVIDEWSPDEVIIEAKSTGLALIPEVSVKYGAQFKLISIDPGTKSKEDRAIKSIPFIQSHVFFPDVLSLPHCVWVSLVLYEVLSFPNARTMDLFDCLNQVLNHYFTLEKKKSSTKAFYGLV
jgi:hypothetical protein